MSSRRLVLTMGALTGVFAAGYGVLFTVLDDFRDRYGISPGALGVVVAVGFFSSFVAQVLLAPMADRGHARRLVLTGLGLNVVGLVAMAFAHDELLLVIARIVLGIGAGMALPALRRIVILADPEHLGSNIGHLLAADVAGFAAGPAISAVLVEPFGLASPFLVIAVVSVAFVPLFLRVHVDETVTEAVEGTRFAFDLLRSRPLVGAISMGAAVYLMIGTFDALWVLVLDDLDTSVWIANLGITMFALPLFFFGSVGGRLSQRIGPFRVGTVGLLMGAAFMTAYGQLPSGIAIFVVSLFHAVNDSLTVTSSGVAVGMVAPPDRQAGAQGMLGGTQTLVGGLSALLAGWTYEHHGRGWAYGACAALMVALVLTARLCVGPTFGRRPEPAPEAVLVGDSPS